MEIYGLLLDVAAAFLAVPATSTAFQIAAVASSIAASSALASAISSNTTSTAALAISSTSATSSLSFASLIAFCPSATTWSIFFSSSTVASARTFA